MTQQDADGSAVGDQQDMLARMSRQDGLTELANRALAEVARLLL